MFGLIFCCFVPATSTHLAKNASFPTHQCASALRFPFVRARHCVFLASHCTKQIFSRGPGPDFLDAGSVHQHRTVNLICNSALTNRFLSAQRRNHGAKKNPGERIKKHRAVRLACCGIASESAGHQNAISDQYLIADRNAEIAMARSAAPQAVSRDEKTLCLGGEGTRLQWKERMVSFVWWS